MTKKILRDAIIAGIHRRTLAFNEATFPQISEEWTEEQQAIFRFLNGESGGFKKLNESDKPEIAKTLLALAGLPSDVKSRFNLEDLVTVPSYVVVVFREARDGYPESFPLLHGRLLGYWTPSGTGSSREPVLYGKSLRPATEDDIRTIAVGFPDKYLGNLYGAIDFPDNVKLRAALVGAIAKATDRLAKSLETVYPDGISDKGKSILSAVPSLDRDILKVLSIILEDPKLLEPWQLPPANIEFLPFCAVVHHDSSNGQSYGLNRVHVQADVTATDVFFSVGDETQEYQYIGNHADSKTRNLRIATPEEIKEYVDNIPEDRLHMYIQALTTEQVTSLL